MTSKNFNTRFYPDKSMAPSVQEEADENYDMETGTPEAVVKQGPSDRAFLTMCLLGVIILGMMALGVGSGKFLSFNLLESRAATTDREFPVKLVMPSTPQTALTGAKDVPVLKFTISTKNAVEIRESKFMGYIDTDGIPPYSLGEEFPGAGIPNYIGALKLINKDGAVVAGPSPMTRDGMVAWSDVITLPPGTTELTLVADFPPGAILSPFYFSFDTGHFTYNRVGTTRKRTITTSINGGTSPLTFVTLKPAIERGSLSVKLSPTTPIDHAVYWGKKDDVGGIWRFTSSNEGFYLETLTLGEDDVAQVKDFVANVDGMSLVYNTKDGATLTTGPVPISSTGTAVFRFIGEKRPYVPKDGSADIKLQIAYRTKVAGATSGKQLDFALIADDALAGSFRAIGEASGAVWTETSPGIETVDQDGAGTDIIVYRAFPEFSLLTPVSTKLTSVDPVLSFQIDAEGLADSSVLFDGKDPTYGSIVFEVKAMANANTVDVPFSVRNGVGDVIDTGVISISPTGVATPLVFDFEKLDQELGGGGGKAFHLYLNDVSKFTKSGSYFQLLLKDDKPGVINWTDNGTLPTASVPGFLKMLPMNGYFFTR